MQKKNKTILFICPYPIDSAPSQRFRFEQYFNHLKQKGFVLKMAPFWNKEGWSILYQKGNALKKIGYTLIGFSKRLLLLPQIGSYDYIFIHREATPLGPPWWELIVGKIIRKKIIYDFDDAIWIPAISKENFIVSVLKCHSKVKTICGISYTISCGNEFLCSYAREYNSRVILNPTTIDTDLHKPRNTSNHEKIVIGWTGTHSTNKYLSFLIPALKRIEEMFPEEILFLVISDKNPAIDLKMFKFLYWTKEKEIEDLQKIDIGVMPLTEDQWSKGKCGFKVLQYMGIGIPAIASPVGVNKNIIKHGVNGFLCEDENKWIATLEKLIRDEKNRYDIGAQGRLTVKKNYSVVSNSDNFLSLFT